MEDYDPFAVNDEPQQDSNSTAPQKEEPKPDKVKEEPTKSTGRRATMAMGGKPLTNEIPASNGFPEWPESIPDEHYVPSDEIDFTDLHELNRELLRARSRSFRIKNAIINARRNETEANSEYRRAYNRALVGISGGSAETRKAMAEIATEELYSQVLVTEGVVKELVNLSYTASRDLDTLKTISDNLRKQLSL